MPPRIPWQASATLRQTRNSIVKPNSGVCLLCRFHNLANRRAPRKAQWPKLSGIRARKYTDSASATSIASQTREGAYGQSTELHNALTDLQKNAGSYVDLSRLQLALRGLEQGAGKEIIRIAVMGIAGKQDSLATVKELLRLALADPLKDEQEWEQLLLNESVEMPVLLRFGSDEAKLEGNRMNNNLIREIYVHSPTLNGHDLEILVLETDAQPESDMESDILVPAIEIPMSSTGRYTPITTPVHKALVIGDGLLDTIAVAQFAEMDSPDVVGTALNLPGYPTSEQVSVPFPIIDIKKGNSALSSIRQSVENAMTYEYQWFQSGLPVILDWLKSGTISTPGVIKAPVLNLIKSIISETTLKVVKEQTSRSAKLLSSQVPQPVIESLRKDLENWAEGAHTELRDGLDIAFQGQRWRKLSWYKLFWRVDDVSHLTTSILTQRFLVSSEKDLIYLCGKMDQAGIFKSQKTIERPQPKNENWAFDPAKDEVKLPRTLGNTPLERKYSDFVENEIPEDTDTETSLELTTSKSNKPWPTHIPATRTQLTLFSIPALQALAQKLVFQTLGTSAFSTFLAGMIYLSEISSSFYEVGAVAAFGIVWGLKRMQGKWEGARRFWEGEVREMGRETVKVVECQLEEKLVERKGEGEVEEKGELDGVLVAVGRVENALRGVEVEGKGGEE